VIWTTVAVVAAAGLVVLRTVHMRHPAGLAAFAAPQPVVHHGADEHWHPAAEVAPPPPAATATARLDLDAQLLLADFDALVDSWRVDPPWLTEWRETVDATYAAWGLPTEAHHRWRYGALDVPTGEYPLVAATDGA
jgi:hypothetical protein